MFSIKPKRPLILGLTGSIGMGKSTVSRFFARKGAAIFNADATVHALLKPEGAGFKTVASHFPQALFRGKISRARLGEIVFQDPAKREELEGILHPFVWKALDREVEAAKKKGVLAVVLDIPLLFETGIDQKCDITLCVTAKASVQKERVLSRKNMTEAKLKKIMAGQMPDAEKRRRADIVLRTDKSLADTKEQVTAVWVRIQKGGAGARDRS